MSSLPKRGLGVVLRRERESQGMSRRDLAEAAGLSYPYVSELETGTKYPSERAIANLAAALDQDPYDLEQMARAAEDPDAAAEALTSRPPAAAVAGLEDRLVREIIAQLEPAIRSAVRSGLESLK